MRNIKQWLKNFYARLIQPPQWVDVDDNIQNLKKEYEEITTSNKESLMWIQKMRLFWLIWLCIFIIWWLVIGYVQTIVIVIGSYLISMIVDWPIQQFRRMRLSKWVSILIVYSILILVIILSIIFILPLVIWQISSVTGEAINRLSAAQGSITTFLSVESIRQIEWLPAFAQESIIDFLQSADKSTLQSMQWVIANIISESRQFITIAWWVIFSTFSWLVNVLWEALIILTLSIMFSIEKDRVVDFIWDISWKKYYNISKLKLKIIYQNLSLWFKHRIILSAFMFICMYLSFIILSLFGIDIPYKFELSLILAILDIIPYIGPIIAWAFMFVVAFWEYSFGTAIIIPAIVMIINLIENSYLIPTLMNKSLWVSLVVTFVFMVLWLITMWVFGAFLSVPLSVVVTILYKTSHKNIDTL